MSFRRKWFSRLPVGLIDLTGHGVLAYFLPGPWWFQFIPDIFLLVILPRSFGNNRLLPEDDMFLFLHKLMHTLTLAVILIVIGFFAISEDLMALGLQWAMHILWDLFTHQEPEFKKSLWWPAAVRE